MSDGDTYDADGDVGRYLNFPSPEDHPYGLSEPADGTLGSHFQYAPPTEQAFPAAPQTLPAPATVIHGQPPPDSGVQLPATGIYGQPAPDFGIQLPATGIHGHPAPPQTQNVASEAPAIDGAEHYEMAPPLMNGGHYEAAPINNNAEQYEAPAVNAYDHHMAGMDVEPQYEEMVMDVQPTHMLNPEMQQGYGFPDQTLGQGDGVHGQRYQYQAPIMDASHYVAPPPINGEPYQAQILNAQHHQVPAMDNIGQYEAMAVDVQQPAHTVAPETQQAYGVPEPTPMQGVGGVDAVHYEAPPPINAHQHYEAPGFNDEHHQVQAMAMDVVQPPTHAPPPEEQMPQQQGDGVDGAPWLEGGSMFPPPSPTMCRMLDELAAMIESEATDGAEGDAGADAEAAAPAPDDNVGPADEEVTFKPLITGRPDCSRCRSVREVLALHGVSKIHFAVHSAYPETFEHAIIDRMIMDPDGQFRTKVLLYLDLRGRKLEWVQNFIAKSVKTMKTKNAGLVQDTCGPSTSYDMPAGGDNSISAPQPSNHGHMELEVDMLTNLMSATAPIGDQAAIPEAAQPAQAQGNTDVPSVSEAAQAVVTQEQGNTDAPYVAEATPSEAAQPSVITQAQDNTNAPPPSVGEAAAPETAAPPEATQQPSATQAAQENPPADAPSAADGAAAVVPAAAAPAAVVPAAAAPAAADALDRFPPFNWDGFRPDHIVESSQVPPYDPASGVDVLMYPSMQEHLRMEALKREEGKKLSKMTVQDTPDYLNINDDHLTNAPNFTSALFKLLCQKDPTYRMFKRRISSLSRRIKKLEQSATKVGTGGLFKIKQKMETFKSEKEELYDAIHRGMQELENAGRNDDGAGPSSSNAAGPSNVAGNSNDAAGPSNVAGTPNEDDASPSNVTATSSEDAGPSSSTTGTE